MQKYFKFALVLKVSAGTFEHIRKTLFSFSQNPIGTGTASYFLELATGIENVLKI